MEKFIQLGSLPHFIEVEFMTLNSLYRLRALKATFSRNLNGV